MRSHLRSAGRNELVDHDLRAVGEVAELRLPQRQRVRLGGRIAVLEAEHGLFRQQRVDDLEAALLAAEVVERVVTLLGLLVEDHRMALRERAALGVLAGQAHAMAFLEQRAERQRLAGRPIDAFTGFDRLGAVVEKALHRAVDVEAVRHPGDGLADCLELVDRQAGIAAARIVGVLRSLEAGPAAVEPIGLVGLVALAGLELGFEPRAPVGLHLLDFAFGDDSLADQLLGIDLQRRRMRADLLVHQRLGERRLVAFVVAEAPVAQHVDHDRALEFHAILDRDLGRVNHRFRIVAVHVQDQRFDHLGDVGRIGRRARIARIGGEADLVVDDEVQRAAGLVALEIRRGRSTPLRRPGRRTPRRRE